MTLAAMLLAGLAVVLVPVAVRNAVVGGEFHLTTSQFGPNFYIGNNDEADGTYRPLRYGHGDATFERTDATILAEQALGRSLTPRQASRYWTRRALDYITAHPGDWLALMGRKFALLGNAAEAVDTESRYSHEEWSLPLRLTGYVTHFGVLGPLALYGVWVTWSRRDKLWLVYLLGATYAVSILVFYVFARYRYPLWPFLTLFAAAGVVDGHGMLRTPIALRRVAAPLAATVAMAVFSNWPMVSKDEMRATTEDTWGTALREAGRFDEAVERYRVALSLDPDYAAAHNNLAVAFRALGQPDEATRHFRDAVRLEPDVAAIHYNLANVLAQQGKLAEAIEHFERALAIDPEFTEAKTNLAEARRRQRQKD